MSEYSQTRKKPRSPLGVFIAGFLAPEKDNRVNAVELLGQERADQVFRALKRLKIRELKPGKGGPLGPEVHDENDPHVGRFLAYLTIQLEQMSPENGRACGRALWQGRTRVWDKEQQRPRYVPAAQAGGVAARLGLSPREVQRFAALAEYLGLVERWQVKSPQAVEQLPKRMRGKRWSYGIYRWVGELPRGVVSRIQAWWRGKAPASPQQLVAAAPAERGASRSLTTDRALQEALSRFGEAILPRPLPS